MGRGGVLAGAMLACIGFFMPLVEARSAVASGIELASEGATNLWLTPIAALSLLWILWLRRRPNQMRAARLAILGLCVGGVLPLLYTTRRVALMADFASADAHWLAGLWTMAGGLVLSGVSSFWLGREPEPARPSC